MDVAARHGVPPPNLVEQVVRALVLYALAETQQGHARRLAVSVDGLAFAVEDDGRGHAIARQVDGAPYLRFIYTHLAYPFDDRLDRPIQLQGLGLSLITSLCDELQVQVRKPTASLRLGFRAGQLETHEVDEQAAEATGNRLAGRVDARFEARPADPVVLRRWLVDIAVAHPAVSLQFNGEPIVAACSSAPPGHPTP